MKKAPAKKKPQVRIDMSEPAAEWVPLSALKRWKKNPRNNKKAVAAVVESIKLYGFGAPLIARKADGEIIGGDTRIQAAQMLELEAVPVRYMDLPADKAHALALLDNKANEIATWDAEKVTDVLTDLEKTIGDIARATGFSERDVAMMRGQQQGTGSAPDPQLEKATQLRKKWKTELGQVWMIPSRSVAGKSHAITCGDSRDVDVVQSVFGKQRADAMWTDPPYGVAYVGKTKDALTIQNDKLKGDALRQFLVAVFERAQLVLKAGAAFYIAHPAGALSLQFLLAVADVKWNLHQSLVWVKDRFALGHSDYHYAHEPILFGYTPGDGRRGRGGSGWFGDNAQSSVFSVPRPSVSDTHPTTKPVELIMPAIQNSCPPAGRVYEPFSGSGSTMAACEATGRVCSAVELEPKYCAVTLQRMADMGLKPQLLPTAPRKKIQKSDGKQAA